jgi:DNA-binding NarL/FixJ family response regulator
MKGIKEEVTGPPLSARETEVLQLLAEGLTTSGIAKRLRLSSATVGTYVNRLMEKLHLKNRASAIIYAARHYPATKK